ncbi:porin [Paraburkholderia lycopersici]|uniref:Outer membrane protein (Porin) n=1 Tax=Paraburkholderia lycopersici TaxID=416944 RepID=A0A1G6W446_9BURK|nr:porin [Paraburkholderia lycopersici]SDD60652.1 Outer membrane protein (porin) [Paraburkholderia lycopersici]
MKKTVTSSMLFLLATGMAHAQSSVSMYGSIDEGITYNTNAKGHGTATVGPVAVPDFYGIRGTEDLGNHLKAIFALQNGFLSSTGAGTIAGEAFSHFSWVGLSSDYGTLTLGRQLDLNAEVNRVNANGAVQYTFYAFHPANLDNLGIRGDSINNSIKYATPSYHGLSAAFLYGFGDGTTQLGRVISADITYKSGPLRVAAVYSGWRNHSIDLATQLGYTSFLGQQLTSGKLFLAKDQNIIGLSAFYSASPHLDLHGVLTQVNLDAEAGEARMRTAELGADIHVTHANTIAVGGYLSWLSGTRYENIGVGDLHQLSRRTLVYAQVTYEHADGFGNAAIPLLAPSNSPNQTAIRVGVHHFF